MSIFNQLPDDAVDGQEEPLAGFVWRYDATLDVWNKLSEAVTALTPQSLFVSLKGADNTIGRDVDNNVTFTYHRDDEDDNYIATITNVAIVDAPAFITDAASSITTFTVVTSGTTDVVAVKRIYRSTDAGSPTKILIGDV